MRSLALALLLSTPLLSACVAVAALPVLAGGAMVAGGNLKIRAATPRPEKGALANAGREMTAGTGVVLTNLTALPAPASAEPGAVDAWQRFFAYALDHSGERKRSVLLESGTSLALPRMRTCDADVPAVLIDLDPDTRPFIPQAAKAPAKELAAGLARLREAGVAVVWVTALPASYVAGVADALQASGLDPAGKDPLLLARDPGDRKQALREEANRDVCVIAVAGDRKNDFDELFDYLRDPASAAGLDYLLGAGWFIVPPPLG